MSNIATIEQLAPERQTLPAITPAQMLQIAVEQNADLDKLERLMALQERWEAAQAKKAYIEAIAAFKQDPPDVVKDMQNGQFKNSGYVSLANLVNTVNRSLGTHGLVARWDVEQPDGQVKVTCILTHAAVNNESVSMVAPPDTSGGGSKNPIQQIKSTVTYLQAATFQAITGIVARAACADDDGNGAGGAEDVGPVVDQLLAAESMNDLQSQFKSAWGRYPKSRKELTAAKDTRKAELIREEISNDAA